MSTIRVVWGAETGPTETAAFDAALAAANIHNYNLITVSSVVPADPPVEQTNTAPDLGPTGNALTVVESRSTVEPGADRPAVAGIGWVRSESGRGLFYETDGHDEAAVEQSIRDGLAAGKTLREWTFDDEPTIRIVSADPDPEAYACAVVAAAYGQSRPIVES